MNAYEKQKLIEVVLYILNKIGGVYVHSLFNRLCFAEKEHISAVRTLHIG
jgi:hypothetical protein